MHTGIYEKLKQVAKAQQVTTYNDIAPLAGLDMGSPADREAIGTILGDISTHEHNNARPMLSAVVIVKGQNMPGRGFFVLARQLGLQTTQDDVVFFAQELIRVHAAWRQSD